MKDKIKAIIEHSGGYNIEVQESALAADFYFANFEAQKLERLPGFISILTYRHSENRGRFVASVKKNADISLYCDKCGGFQPFGYCKCETPKT